MRTLVIDSASEACSVALFDDGKLIAGAVEILGRGHAERLVPMIAELPDRGRSDRIAVSVGPGSFTGARIGVAAARALGLAWQAEVVGYPTLPLVAAMALADDAAPVTVAMTGGHGEWFVQSFDAEGVAESDPLSLPPSQAAASSAHPMVAGSQAEALIALRGTGKALAMLPDARQWNRLASHYLIANPSPIYGRAPDARLPA